MGKPSGTRYEIGLRVVLGAHGAPESIIIVNRLGVSEEALTTFKFVHNTQTEEKGVEATGTGAVGA